MIRVAVGSASQPRSHRKLFYDHECSRTPLQSMRGRESVSLSPVGVIALCLPQQRLRDALIVMRCPLFARPTGLDPNHCLFGFQSSSDRHNQTSLCLPIHINSLPGRSLYGTAKCKAFHRKIIESSGLLVKSKIIDSKIENPHDQFCFQSQF